MVTKFWIYLAINGFAGIRGIVPTFLSTSWLLQSLQALIPRRQNIVSMYKVSYLLTKHELCKLFCSKMYTCVHYCIHVKSTGIWIKL